VTASSSVIQELVPEPPRYLAPIARTTETDFISIVETVYQLNLDDRQWLEQTLCSIAPLIDSGFGAFAYFLRVDEDRLHIGSPIFLGCPDRLYDGLTGAGRLTPKGVAARAYTYAVCGTLSEARGIGAKFADLPEVRDGVFPIVGARDKLSVHSVDTDGTGVSFSACLREVTSLAPRRRNVLTRLAAHIASAQRLRAALRAPSYDGSRAEAVFDAGGRLVHAEGEATERTARDALVLAVRQMEEGRGPLRKEQPEVALRLWRALIDGRWSLVQQVDHDGKRYMVACRNSPRGVDPAALNERERTLAQWAVHGHSIKFMAHELGVAPATVSEQLKTALRKLGIRSRAELAARLSGRPPARPERKD
jgi:DNA-binding CsgD family transcriptional regulator